MRKIKFYLRTLIAEQSDKTGQKLTYSVLSKATNTSTNTLSHIANNSQKRVDLEVLLRLCTYFQCELSDLMRIELPDPD